MDPERRGIDLIRIEDERYVFSAGLDREVQLTRDLGLARVVKGHERLEFTPPTHPPWPLEVGKVERAVSALTGSAAQFLAGRRAPATADRSTSPGRWKATSSWRCRRVGPTRSPLAGDADRVFNRLPVLYALRLWYAPELGQIVKAESRELHPLNFEVVALERERRHRCG